MPRYAILSTSGWEHDSPPAPAGGSGGRRHAGQQWLFRVGARIDDVEEAVRDAVGDFFASPEGARVRAREVEGALRWEEAIAWVPDEVWARHGLDPVRHPEVECVRLDPEEDLAAGWLPLPPT